MAHYVYILTNRTNTVLYTGITGDLLHRVLQHRSGTIEGFTKRYKVNRLVYFEEFAGAFEAITREKQIKALPRRRKMQLVDEANATWRDLYSDYLGT